MILSDKDIRHRLAGRGLEITPYTPSNVEPCSIDLTLGDVDTRKSEDGEWIIYAGEFLLASTVEFVRIPDDLCAFVHGKSTWGRKGLIIETAGVVDPGFSGELTLELVNVSADPIVLRPNVKICQLVIHRMLSPAEFPYGHPSRQSKYVGQKGPTRAR